MRNAKRSPVQISSSLNDFQGSKPEDWHWLFRSQSNPSWTAGFFPLKVHPYWESRGKSILLLLNSVASVKLVNLSSCHFPHCKRRIMYSLTHRALTKNKWNNKKPLVEGMACWKYHWVEEESWIEQDGMGKEQRYKRLKSPNHCACHRTWRFAISIWVESKQ